MSEVPFFFERDSALLFGMLHESSGVTQRTGFVMSHPFGEEKLWSHRIYVTVARALAAHGYPVLRFDYMGAGDSSGFTHEVSLQTHLADLSKAVEQLAARRPEVEKIGLIGLRLGATIAALFAEQCAQIANSRLQSAPIVLWDPVLDGHNYFQEVLRSNLSMQMAAYGKVIESRDVLRDRILSGVPVNVDGYEIGKSLYESCAVPTLLSPAELRHQGPVLVTQISATEQVKDRDDLRAVASGYARGEFGRAVEQPFWREIKPFCGRAQNLEDMTLQWLERNRG